MLLLVMRSMQVNRKTQTAMQQQQLGMTAADTPLAGVVVPAGVEVRAGVSTAAAAGVGVRG
jgi:hypothetical protein